VTNKGPLRRSGGLYALMASHWPPGNLPMTEVELLADGPHHRSGAASSQTWGIHRHALDLRQRGAL